MKALLYAYNTEYAKELAIRLIPFGMETFPFSSEHDIQAEENNEESPFQVIFTEKTEKEFLENLKKKYQNQPLIILTSKDLPPSEMRNLIPLGISTIMKIKNQPEAMVEEIVQFMTAHNIRSKDKRLHIRVQPKPHETATASVYLKKMARFVKGKILDISAGGFALAAEDSLEISLLAPGELYDNVILSLNGKEIKTVARMIVRRDVIAGFKFENVEPNEMYKIATYIYNHLEENYQRKLKSMMSESE
ncbi:PilZ domain-containing protein [Thermospira aquatica]|uniref:PilZ domain-containing protein n=1 Tax=Thermospira aquatica TaxID=2828656 RepID=A0AAX3BF33_9SPIR|nr:PilZ domain-containing protein [Thermospira aquatica]URA10907.1 PilZ domain-containing protein [Thermospira aquatica]